MSDEVQPQSDPGSEIPFSGNYLKIGLAALGAVAILTVITVGAYQYAKKRSGVTVLPGGTTYLGATQTPKAPPVPPPSNKFSVSATTAWQDYKGKTFPFTFSYPSTLNTVVFPKDPTDSVAIAFGDIPPQNNILFRVIDIRQTEPKMIPFIGKPKEYVANWWTQWSGLKGVRSLDEFTNSKGMKGYRTRYLNQSNEAPNEDVFFIVPGRTDLMIRFGNGVLDTPVFDRIIDTFDWTQKTVPVVTTPQTTPAQ